MKKLKLRLGVPALAALVAVVALTIVPTASPAPTAQAAAPTATATGLVQTLTGSATNSLGQLVNYNLTATINRFANQNGQLVALGTVSGTVTNTVTSAVTTLDNQPFTVPVLQLLAGPTCTILDLTLGPLDLNVLGLLVHLDQVHLTITGQTGPGNLLGNLLCGLANALNGGGGGGIANLLNRLLGLL